MHHHSVNVINERCNKCKRTLYFVTAFSLEHWSFSIPRIITVSRYCFVHFRFFLSLYLRGAVTNMLLDACFRLAQVCLIFFSVYSNAHFLRKAGSKPAVKKATRVPSVHDTLQLRAQSRSVEFANKVVPAKIVRPENDGNPYWNYFKQVWVGLSLPLQEAAGHPC